MADVIIRGMEMPATCWNCKLKVGFSACGLVTDHKDGGFFYRVHEGNSRPDWCPILPLPEGHGRLGDLDKINASLGAMMEIEDNHNDAPYSWSHAYTEMQSILDDATTIVPAEGGGEENE